MKKQVFALFAIMFFGQGSAVFVVNFENPPYNGSTTGVALDGQDGWFIPAVGSSGGQSVWTYAGNGLGLSSLPVVGGLQFIGSLNVDGVTLNRGQHNHDFSGITVWTQSFYECGKFNGTGVPVNNLGSTSLSQGPNPFGGYQGFIALNEWDDSPITGTRYRDSYIHADAGGLQIGPDSPGPAWEGLVTDHWYRQSSTFDLVVNKLIAITITDMNTGITTTATPPFGTAMTEWYLGGGANNVGGVPPPDGMRHFTGGNGNAGNVMAWDNTKITPGMLLVPNSFSIGPGIILGGDVRHLYESEDQKLVARPGVVISSAQAPVDILVRFTAPTTTPSEVDIVVESSANQANIGQTIALRNNSAVDEVLDSHTLTLADTTTTVAVTTNASRFVDPATRQIIARIRCKAVGPILSYPWQARFDRVVITGTP